MAYVAKHYITTWKGRYCLISSEDIHMAGNDLALYHFIQQVPLFPAIGTESISMFIVHLFS